VKKFTSYKHVVVILFAVFEDYHSIRDAVLGLLSNTNKLGHLGLNYVVMSSTLSDANVRRPNELFAKKYYDTNNRNKDYLSDSSLSKKTRYVYISCIYHGFKYICLIKYSCSY